MSNIEQTLSIIKPDAVERHLENEIKEIFKNNAFLILKEKKIQIEKYEAEKSIDLLLPPKINCHVHFAISRKILPKKEILELIESRPESGILSIGRVPSNSLDSLRKLAEELGWPVFADVTSGLRLGNNCPNRITYYDHLLHDDLISSNWEIEAVWHIGFPPTSNKHLGVLYV